MRPVPRRPATEAEAKALASTTRLRILRLCLDQPLTNREIAGRLGAHPATTLHHVRKLVDNGFLAAQPVRRGTRGAREIPYLATGKSWTLDMSAHGGSRLLVDTLQQELALVADPSQIVTSRLALRLTEQEYADLARRIQSWLDELAASAPSTGGRPYSMFIALHPDPGRD